MEKVTEYQVVKATLTSIQRVVNESIREGWVPSDPFIEHDGYLLQVMVKFG
jgi:hypothetical protein